ncbi:TolC family protein [Thermomonas sp. S9]|uniref:TolC family protein n=1 Tax=Thermomonas sp. S9 TaxID=2885203 RepID=UPI00216AD9F8|nr:TolC family protein [Thermomonas sp. S9]MCR6497008.1 TolC family protein [Thermomonas sp. S9]
MIRSVRPLSALTLALLLAGCASYAPQPLAQDPAVLAPPLASVLQARAEAIQRPWLAPVRIDLQSPLDDAAVAALAVVNGPDLIALRTRAGVADAQAFAAGLLPDPTFSLGADKVLRGPDTLLNLSAALGFDLNALRTRALTRAQAIAQARSVRLDLAWAEWQAAGQARLQAARIRAYQRQLPLLRDSARAAAQLADASLRAATRGDAAADAAQAQRLAALDAQTRLRTLEQNLRDARQTLNRLLGLPPDIELALVDAPTPDIAPPPLNALFAQARAQRSDLAALRAGYAAQEAALHRAILQQFPSLNLTLTGNRDSAGNLLLGPALDFTLPLWNRNRGNIAVETATRASLRAEYEARLFQTRADLEGARQALLLALRQRAAAQADAPALRQQAAAAQAAAARGDLSQAAAETLQQAWRDRQLLLAQLDQTIAEQRIALQLLVGAPIEDTP